MSSHLMELPSKVFVGYGVLCELGVFVKKFGFRGRVLIVTGENIKKQIQGNVEASLAAESFTPIWTQVSSSTLEYVEQVEALAQQEGVEVVIGLGGGKCVDVAKLGAYNARIPCISVPTSASHDGISSPFASIRGDKKPYSYKTKPPIGILADVDLIAYAPSRLLASGCGDLVSKLTAISDWCLARDEKGEYYGNYAASLALLSAEIVMSESKNIAGGGRENIRYVVEALISAGVAAGIAGSSRPCSGSEHLFGHALEVLAPNKGLHGEKCGIGTILMAKLHEVKWERVREALIDVHAPTTSHELGISPEVTVEAIVMASSIRPERYTILHKLGLDRKLAWELAKFTGVI